MTRKIAVLAAVLAAALGAAPVRAQVPQVLTYSGYLKTSAGAPVTTVTNLTFRLYAAPSGGAALWTETVSTAPSPDGWFSVVLGGTSPLPLSALGNDAYLAIQFESEAEFTQRARLTPSHAAIAVDWTRVTNRPSACTAGQFLTGYDASGTALCATPPTGGTGGVSSIVAGERISVSGTGAVTISLTGCPTAGQILRWEGTGWACVADSTGTLSAVQGLGVISAATTGGTVQLSLGGCGATANQILQWNGASWACIPTPTPVGGGVSSVGVTSPIVNNGSATAPVLALTNACASGQVLKWNGTTWACANDQDTTNPGTVTSVAPAATAGNPISVANGTGAATIDLPPAGAGASGYLRATDWSAFNAKLTPPSCAVGQIMKWDGSVWSCAADAVNAGTVTGVTATAPVVSSGGSAPVISMPAAAPGQSGYLTGADWTLFNSKITAPAGCAGGDGIVWDPVGVRFACQAVVSVVSVTSPLGASSGGGVASISIQRATAAQDGYLTAPDFSAFAQKLTPPTCGAGQTITWNGSSWVCGDVALPVQIFGRTSTAPILFMPQADAINDGFLAGADWALFDAKVSGIAPGPGITVDGISDPRNPVVGISFPATGARNGSATQPARADHEHGKATITASFANTSDTVSGGTLNKGDGAAVLTTTSGVASVLEMKNISSSFALGLPVTGSTLSFQANASSVTDSSQFFYVFFGGPVGSGSQTGGFGFRIQGNGAGGRVVTGFTMGAGSAIAGSTAAASLGSGVHSFFAVNRGAVVDFYVDGGFIGAGSTAAMNTVVFQTYTVRLEQAATAGSCQATVSFLTLTVPAL